MASLTNVSGHGNDIPKIRTDNQKEGGCVGAISITLVVLAIIAICGGLSDGAMGYTCLGLGIVASITLCCNQKPTGIIAGIALFIFSVLFGSLTAAGVMSASTLGWIVVSPAILACCGGSYLVSFLGAKHTGLISA